MNNTKNHVTYESSALSNVQVVCFKHGYVTENSGVTSRSALQIAL